MKHLFYEVNGEVTETRVAETDEDIEMFSEWANLRTCVAVDTETTGLDLFSGEFRVRTIQFGDSLDAWVLPLDVLDIDNEWLQATLDGFETIVMQNASYDLLALRQGRGIEVSWNQIRDTKILAHLVDPREVKEGGPGLSLSDLTRHYISAEVADDVKDSMTRMAKENKLKKADLFRDIDIWDETYLLYAGMDVILTSRLFNILMPLVPPVSRSLVEHEHELAEVCMEIEANGFLLDNDYAQRFSQEMLEAATDWELVALEEYGVEKVNSGDQVAEALLKMGVKIPDRTPTGKYKVDQKLLESLVEQGNGLAEAVLEAKKAKKWRTTWVQKFLDEASALNRCHASIHPLRARTARMSITGIPAQTLPSGDWKVRRCFIADPGEVVISADYQAQELRVLAALSGDKNMIQAFAEGADLHQITADASGVPRSAGKTTNFAYVYGSGPINIAETCGITVDKAKEVIAGFEKSYPAVKKYNQRLQEMARKKGYVVTPSGRVIPVDKDRAYAALNYMIQSTSRDITAQALIRIHRAGLTKHLRLPIHDEIVASVPEAEADHYCQVFADLMRYTDVDTGLVIDTDSEIYGRSWGSGYLDRDTEDGEALWRQIEQELQGSEGRA